MSSKIIQPAIALALIIVGVILWLYSEKAANQKITNGKSPTIREIGANNTLSEKEKGTALFFGKIDDESLSSGSSKPTITGVYSGTYGVNVVIINDDRSPQTIKNPNIEPAMVEIAYSGRGGDVSISGGKSGTFSYAVKSNLKSGTYTAGIYAYHDIYSENGYEGSSELSLITSKTFIVK